MKLLVATPDRDTAHGKHPFDFSNAFDPEARGFLSRHGGERIMVDMGASHATRQRQVVAAIERIAPECFVWIGHGLTTSIPQLGLDSDDEVAVFTAALAAGCTAPLIVFFACSMAGGKGVGGDGGLCDRIRDATCKHGALGVRAFGHVGAGHCTMRPYARVFDGPEVKPRNIGGRWVIDPGSPLFPRWQADLRGVLRFDYPLISQAELDARLEGGH
jgi:hypothetical protein